MNREMFRRFIDLLTSVTWNFKQLGESCIVQYILFINRKPVTTVINVN